MAAPLTLIGATWSLLTGAVPLLTSSIRGQSTAASRQQTAVGVALLVSGVEVLAALFVTVVIADLITRFLPRANNTQVNPNTKSGRRMRAMEFVSPQFKYFRETAAFYGADTTDETTHSINQVLKDGYLLGTIATLGSIGVLLVRGGVQYTTKVAEMSYSLAPVYTGFSVAALSGYLLNEYADTIVPPLFEAWNCWIRPLLLDWIVLPLLNVGVVMISLLAFGIMLLVVRTSRNIRKTPFKLLTALALPDIPDYAMNVAKILSGAVMALVFWISANPARTLFPFADVLMTTTAFISKLWDGVIYESCKILEYVVGGIGFSVAHPTLALAIDNLLNMWIYIPQTFLLQPLIYGNSPVLEGVDDLANGAANNLALWTQNVTVKQFDIYIGADLTGYVNGSVPVPPDDNIIYLVRFLKARWAEAIGFAVTSVASIAFEIARLAFNPEKWLKFRGNQYLTFEMLRTNAINFVDATETIIDILPQCVVPGSGDYDESANVRFGAILGGAARFVIAVVYLIADLVFGELYTLIEGKYWPGYFAAGYFQANGKQLQESLAQAYRFSTAVGCSVALLDPGIGKFFTGALKVLLGNLVRVPVYMMAYARLALETRNPDIMDALDDSPSSPLRLLEQEALGIANVASFVYRFENVNSRTCTTSLSFICSLGKVLEKVVELVVRAAMLIIRVIRNVVKATVSLLARGTIGNIPDLPIEAFYLTAYTIGCRAGTMVGGIIPIDLTCHASRPNFCAVREFNPVPYPQTPTICVETVLCRVGNWLGAAAKLLATLIKLGANLDFSVGPLVSTLRLFLRILAYDVLSPLCPFAHFIDCWISVFGINEAIVSKFLCLVNSFMVKLIDIVTDVVIDMVQIVIYFTQIVFGTGDGANAFVSLLKHVFNLIRTGISQILGALIGILMQFLIGIIEAFCGLLCICQDCSPCLGCKQLVASMRGQQQQFIDPNYSGNYLKRALMGETTEYPMSDEFRRAFGLTEYIRYTDAVTGATSIVEVPYTFDWQDLPTHLATRVKWTVGTNCHELVKALNGTKLDSLEVASSIMLMDCVREKALAVAARHSSPFLSWLPDDIRYNPMRIWVVLAHVIRYSAVFLEFISDKFTPHDKMMTSGYMTLWGRIGVNTTHYTHEFADLYPGRNRNASDYAPFLAYVKNTTLSWYLDRNFPEIYGNDQTNVTGGSSANYVTGPLTYATALEKTYLGIGNFMYSAIQAQYNYTAYMVSSSEYQAIMSGVDPVTGLNMTDGSYYSLSSVYVYGNTSNVRATIFDNYGDEYVSAYDERTSTSGLYSALSKLSMALFGFAMDAVSVYSGDAAADFHDILDNTNYLNTTTTGFAGYNSAAADSGSDNLYPGWVFPANYDPVTKSFNKRFAAMEEPQREELRQRAARIKRDAEAANADTTQQVSGWSDIYQAILRGYAKGIDHFMRVNGAGYLPDESSETNAKKRHVGATSDQVPVGSIQKRSLPARTIVAVVAAAAAAAQLNTTYTPYWCNSSTESRLLCATSDWRNAALYVADDPAAFNATIQAYLNVTSIAADILRPRSQSAAMARSFTSSVARSVGTFATNVYYRVKYQSDSLGIPEAMGKFTTQSVVPLRVFADKLAEVSAQAQQQQQQKQPTAADLESIVNPNNVDYIPRSVQLEAYRKWAAAVTGAMSPHATTASAKSTGAGPDASVAMNGTIDFDSIFDDEWTSFMDSVRYKKPDAMKLAVPPSAVASAKKISSRQAPTSPVVSMGQKLARAWVNSLTEERAILRDMEKYGSLFMDTDGGDSQMQSGVSASRLKTGVRVINIESLHMRRKLALSALGNHAKLATPIAAGEQIPLVQIRAYKSVYLRSTDYISASSNTSHPNRKERIYTLAYGDDVVRTASGEDLVRSLGAGGVRLYNDVIEIRVLPQSSSVTGTQIDPRKASAASAVRSHFTIGTLFNETLDYASQYLQCYLEDPWLCDKCKLVDQLLGIQWEITLQVVAYYTMSFTSMFLDTAKWLLYAFTPTAPARIGYGEYPARWPALGVDTGYWMRYNAREMANTTDPGPRWAWFFEDRLGVPFPEQLKTNGTAYKRFEFYWEMRTLAESSNSSISRDIEFTPDLTYETIGYLNNTLGIPLLQIWDTLGDYVIQTYPEMANLIFYTIRCDYDSAIDCSTRTYSIAGALSLLFDVGLVGTVLIYALARPLLSLWLWGFGIATIPAVLILSYGWSLGCGIILPSCFVKDAWDFLSLTIFSKCWPGWGLFISSSNYDVNTCATCNSGFGQFFYSSPTTPQYTWMNCRAEGFNNVYDGLIMLENSWLAEGKQIPWKLSVLRSVVDGILGFSDQTLGTQFKSSMTTATRQWSSGAVFNNWSTSKAAFSTYFGCGMWSTLEGVGKVGLATAAAANVALPAVQFIIPIVTTAALGLVNPFTYIRLVIQGIPTTILPMLINTLVCSQLMPNTIHRTIFGNLYNSITDEDLKRFGLDDGDDDEEEADVAEQEASDESFGSRGSAFFSLFSSSHTYAPLMDLEKKMS